MTGPSARLLVVDDEATIRAYMRDVLAEEGYSVTVAESSAKGWAAVERDAPELALVDLMMPDGSGLDLLKRIKAKDPATVVFIITAYASVETAVDALRLGATDYLIKPFATDELKMRVRRALGELGLSRENVILKEQLALRSGDWELLGDSALMHATRELIAKVADSDATVLLTGETGTGKELAARALHRLSGKRAGPFLALNCGAIPETMLERELFGHERGAFTGADATRPGLVEAASTGTLFLDEIGEMPPALQVRLLRILEGHEFTRLGGTRPIRSAARFVAATNQDLGKAVAERRFREDLLFRLNSVSIRLPALRERAEDVPLLAGHFLSRFGRKRGVATPHLTPEAGQALGRYAWPGNVRELRNVVERAVLLSTSEAIGIENLGLGAPDVGIGRKLDALLGLPYKQAREEFDRAFFKQALEAAGGNVSQASRTTGVNRQNLHEKIRELGLGSGNQE